MSALQQFVADLLEANGAAVEQLESDGLEVLAPESLRTTMSWPELVRLGFGAGRTDGAIPIGLEGDWLDRFGTLLAEEGRWSERAVWPTQAVPAPGDPERLLERALDLPNAVWRFRGMTATHTRCLMLLFRYTAVSDEKREGLLRFGFNLGTGAVVNEILADLQPQLAQMPGWHVPDEATRRVAGTGWDAPTLAARVGRQLDRQVRDGIAPFLQAMRRRLERDRARIHAYHDDLRNASFKRLAVLDRAAGERAQAERRRETLRIEAIEREYRVKLDDLRHNYALRISVDWVQALELYVPVQRFDVLIRRRKGERMIQLDWHPLVKAIELPLCEAGTGLDRTRLVCDEKLHLTEPAAQGPCGACGKAYCRACFPAACPRCAYADAGAVPSGGLSLQQAVDTATTVPGNGRASRVEGAGEPDTAKPAMPAGGRRKKSN